jgi:hypothetical protein
VDECIESFDCNLAKRRIDEAGKRLYERPVGNGPGPRIHQDEALNSVGMSKGIGQADGAAPVMEHEREVGEIKPI